MLQKGQKQAHEKKVRGQGPSQADVLAPLEGLSKDIVGLNASIEELARSISKNNLPIIVTGGSGVGKGVLVENILDVAEKKYELRNELIDCTTINPELAESILFGHKKGAFTGAVEDRIGLLREARGKIIFFDEIGNLPDHVKSKLLLAFEGKKLMPLGGGFKDQFQANFRIISATNKDPRDPDVMPPDLYFRIAALQLHIPDLSERRIDIIPLINRIIRKHNIDSREQLRCWSLANYFLLLNFNWGTGGYRQLDQEILFLSREGRISEEIRRHYQIRNQIQPIIQKGMTAQELLESNGKPDRIQDIPGNKQSWFYVQEHGREYEALLYESIVIMVYTRETSFQISSSKGDIIFDSGDLFDRLEKNKKFMTPEELMNLLSKEIECFEAHSLSNHLDPRECFEPNLFLMGLIFPGQHLDAARYVPCTSYTYVGEDRTRTPHVDELVTRKFIFPKKVFVPSRIKGSDLRSNLNRDDEENLYALVSRHNYNEIDRALRTLILRYRNEHQLTWLEIKKKFGIEQRTILKRNDDTLSEN